MRSRALATAITAIVASTLLTACLSENPDLRFEHPTGGPELAEIAVVEGEVVILIDDLLRDPFEALIGSFEEQYPEVEVTLRLLDPDALEVQVGDGTIDVVATVDAGTMQRVRPWTEQPSRIASDPVVLAVPAGAVDGGVGPIDVAGSDVVLAACEAQAPCGVASERVLAVGHLTPTDVIRTGNAADAVDLVLQGTVDAAVLNRSRVVHAGAAVETVTLHGAAPYKNDVQVAATLESPNPDTADAWTSHLTTREAARALRGAGFGPPPGSRGGTSVWR